MLARHTEHLKRAGDLSCCVCGDQNQMFNWKSNWFQPCLWWRKTCMFSRNQAISSSVCGDKIHCFEWGLGIFPAMIFATKIRYFKGDLGPFPSVSVERKPGVFKEISGHFQLCLWCFKPNHDDFLILTKWHLCPNLRRTVMTWLQHKET